MAELQIQFADRCVTYETFVNDLARALVPMVREGLKDPREVVSQRKAYKLYGAGNVKRWIREGKLKIFSKRPGVTEYKVADLELCKPKVQDYLTAYN